MQSEQAEILIVDARLERRAALRDHLSDDGFHVTEAGGRSELRDLLQRRQFDMVLLDVALSDGDGLDILRELRQVSEDVPVIILTDRGEEIDEVLGLEIGADDVVARPLRPRALSARIRTILRRSGLRQPHRETVEDVRSYAFLGWRMDVVDQVLIAPDLRNIPLTTAEVRLLLAFLRQPNEVISRSQLYRHIYQSEPAVGSRSIDVMVGRVRRKLAADGEPTRLIKTIHGRGYTFVAPVTSTS